MERISLGAILFYLTIVVTVVVGWILNVKSIVMMFLHIPQWEIGTVALLGARLLGVVFPPFGAIMGYFI